MRDLPGYPAAFERAAGLAGPDATVQAVRELAGGTHARTWLVRTANPELEVVIREFPAGWRGGVLTGVVDWSGGAVGPAGFDVGWCRLDLYLLYDERIAGIFPDTYEAARGAALPGRLLSDLWAVARSEQTVETWVPDYRDLGRAT